MDDKFLRTLIFFPVPIFAISQLEAVSTVLITWDIKSLIWYCYDIIVTWPNLGTVNTAVPNRTFLVSFGGISDSFGLTMGILARLLFAKKTNHLSAKLAWYGTEAYQKGTIRYKNQSYNFSSRFPFFVCSPLHETLEWILAHRRVTRAFNLGVFIYRPGW